MIHGPVGQATIGYINYRRYSMTSTKPKKQTKNKQNNFKGKPRDWDRNNPRVNYLLDDFRDYTHKGLLARILDNPKK